LDASNDPTGHYQTFKIERAIMAPSMGFSYKQYWPYAPYQEMIVTLAYAPRAALLFFAMAALTLLICGVPLSLRQFALLAGLFLMPFLALMSGYVPYPDSITPAQFAGYQMKTLPVLSLVSLAMAFAVLRKTPRLPAVLILLLMALAMGGYAFIGLQPDEQKRNAAETLIQAGLIGYIFLLTLYTRLRPTLKFPKVLPAGVIPQGVQARWNNWAARIRNALPARFWKPAVLVLVLISIVILSGMFLNYGGPELPPAPVFTRQF
jgi:hypothetical protein